MASSENWIPAKREYSIDKDENAILKGYTEEAKKRTFETKDKIDLIFKIVGSIAVICTLVSTCNAVNNVNASLESEYRKQAALYQLQTYANIVGVNNEIINSSTDSAVDRRNINRLKSELLPKIVLFSDTNHLAIKLKEFIIESERYVLLNDLWVKLRYEDKKYTEAISVLKGRINYLFSDMTIEANLTKDFMENTLFSLVRYLEEKSVSTKSVHKALEHLQAYPGLYDSTLIRTAKDLSDYYHQKAGTITSLYWLIKKHPGQSKIKIRTEDNLGRMIIYYLFNGYDVNWSDTIKEMKVSEIESILKKKYNSSRDTLECINSDIIKLMKTANPILNI